MDDRSLMIKRCQKGDRQAWGQLYAATRQRLLAVCRSYVNDDAVAEDLLHDAYVLILSHVNELKEPSKADAWMTAVARNVSLLYLRERKDLVEQSVDTMLPYLSSRPSATNSCCKLLMHCLMVAGRCSVCPYSKA